MNFFTNNNIKEKGQAFTEFILYFLLSASLFIMLFSIHEKSSRTLNTIIISRNELFSDKMNGSPSPHSSYRYSSTDISRFYAAYKHPDNESQTPLIVVSNSIFTLYKPNMNYRQNENTDRKSLTEGMLFHGGK